MRGLVVWFTGLLVCAQSAVADTIDWYVRDWPPVNILQGSERGLGAYDVMLNRLIAALPQYQHQQYVSSLTMRQQMMQQQRPHCLFGLLKSPQRQTFLQFSEPAAIIPNLQLVARADHPLWQQMLQRPEVELSWLFAQSWQGMVEEHRTYPAPIAAHLNRFVQVSATETNLAQMLKINRADYVLEYPDRMHYLAKGQPELALRTMPLSGIPPVIEVFVACSMSKQAKAQISAINQALKQLRHDPQYQAALLDWLTPQSRQLVKQYMAQSPWFDAAKATGQINPPSTPAALAQ